MHRTASVPLRAIRSVNGSTEIFRTLWGTTEVGSRTDSFGSSVNIAITPPTWRVDIPLKNASEHRQPWRPSLHALQSDTVG